MPRKEIQWSWNIESIIDEALIRNIEIKWGIKFPDEYVNIAKKFDGNTPVLQAIDGNWKCAIVNITGRRGKISDIGLISFLEDEDIKKSHIEYTYDIFKDDLPEPDKIFPFAESGCGDIFFFDYRKNPNEPVIMFLDHEQSYSLKYMTDEDRAKMTEYEYLESNLYFVCNSFTELLDSLYLLED